MAKEKLFGMRLSDLEVVAKECRMPRFAARQMAQWLYGKGAESVEQMTNISKAHRALLSERYEIGLSTPLSVAESSDGTKKYLFGSGAGNFIESAYIPDRERATLCVSSQAGCRMGCEFCMTARQGLKGQLSVNGILNQIASLPERDRLTNIVYMGMGEPLDNIENVLGSLDILTSDWGYGWSPTRITVSTVGVIPALRRFLEQSKAHLAVSLHNPFHDERMAIVPAEKAFPIAEVVNILREYDFTHQRRVSFEYIVMSGMNDSPRHVKEIVRLLDGIKCRINLIRFHKIPGSSFFSPGDEDITRFRDALTSKGIMTTIRSSRGEDIQAACGLLSTARQETDCSTRLTE